MKTINYKGKGEHSVSELELIIEQQAEELHLFKSEKKQLTIPLVIHSKITALVTYWKWQESGHAMLDDTKNKTTEIVEVEKLTDINEMFTNLIDIKILK